MPCRRLKLYPTPVHFQRPDGDWTLEGLIGHLQRMREQIPEDERASAVVEGAREHAIYYTHKLSQLESDQERMMLLFNELNTRAQGKQGLSAEDVDTLLKRFHALA